MAKILDDADVLLEFYRYPAEHSIHLRTTNSIESTFATVRLRTTVTKGSRLTRSRPGHGLQTDRGRPDPLARGQRPTWSPSYATARPFTKANYWNARSTSPHPSQPNQATSRSPKTAIPWRAVKPADHIVALRRDSNRIASAAEGRLDRIVPSCPGWQVADLVWHVGIVHMFWRMVARGALTGPAAWSEPDRPDNDDLVAWFRDGVDLTATIPGRPGP